MLLLAFPRPSAYVFSGVGSERPGQPIEHLGVKGKTVQAGSLRFTGLMLSSRAMQFRKRTEAALHSPSGQREKYDLNPRLIASVMVVESRNPFAISGKDAVGIMRVHLPTGIRSRSEGISFLKSRTISISARASEDLRSSMGLG
jgi:hypothetical protein